MASLMSQAQLRFSPLSNHKNCTYHTNFHPSATLSFPCYSSFQKNLHLLKSHHFNLRFSSRLDLSCGGGSGNDGIIGGHGNGGWSEGGGDDGYSDDDDNSKKSFVGFGILGAFINGWRSRVAADPQFPFKVLMEELVGVSANVLGDMASRPNFGLNELDFVFSTLVVGCIVNFTIMYLLAPSLSSTSPCLPSIFANCPPSHMFEPGAYGLRNRFGTFVYKGLVFSAVGFAAGLVGTSISNGLIKLRKKMDPSFESPNKPPPTLLNAITWSIHMGVNSNFRYQTLNGVEFVLEKGLPPLAFKTSVTALRCLNNILGGMTFVMLARMTGSQGVDDNKKTSKKLEDSVEYSQSN